MDKFDDIWKNRFNTSDVPDDAWNMPDNQVWDSIAKTLPEPKEDKKTPVFFWIGIFSLLSLLLGLALAALYFQNQTPNTKVINSFGNTQNEKRFNEHKEISTTYSKEVIQKNNVLINKQEKNVTANSSSKFDAYLNITRKAKKQENVTITAKEISGYEPAINTIQSYSKPSTSITVDTEKTSILNLNPLAYIELSPLELSQATINAIPALKVSKKTKLQLSTNVGMMFWKHQFNQELNDALSPFDFNYKDAIGVHLNIEATYPINEYLDVYTGLGYDNISISSGHNSPIQYSLLDELNEPNNLYTLALATPYGFTNSSFLLERNTIIDQEQTDLLVDFTNKHHIQNISMPLGVHLKPFGKHRHFQPSISLGFGVNYLAKIKNNLDNIDTHHDALFYQSNSASLSRQETENLFFDYRLGGGLKYKKEGIVDIGMHYNFVKGLSPVFKLNNLTSTINRHYITIKLTKTIK